MNYLKECPNLRGIYKSTQRKWIIMALVSFLAFGFSFVSIILDLPELVSILTMAMGIVGVCALVCMLSARIITARNLKRFTYDELTRIDRELPMTASEEGFYVTRDALLHGKGQFFLYPVRDIIWVYKNVMTVRYMGIIPISKSSSIMIGGRDHKRHGTAIKNKGHAAEFVEAGLKQYRNGIFFGYSDELERMFTKEFDRMLAISREYDAQGTYGA